MHTDLASFNSIKYLLKTTVSKANVNIKNKYTLVKKTTSVGDHNIGTWLLEEILN